MQKFLYPRFRSFQFFSSFSVSCFVFLSFFFFFFLFLFLGDLFTVMPVPTERRLLSFQKKLQIAQDVFFILFFMHCEKKPAKSKSQFSENLEIGPTVKQQEVNSKQTLGEFLLMTQKREQQFGSVQAHPSFQTQTNKQTTKDNNFKTLTWLLFGSKQQHRHRQQSLNSSHSHLLFDRNGSVSCGCRRPRVGSRTKTFFSQQ